MSQPVTLQDDFELGFKQDFSRDDMPHGAVWDVLNYLPRLGAPLRKRGGWSYASNDISATDGTVTNMRAIGWAPGFAAGSRLFGVSQNSKLFKVNESTLGVTSVGALSGLPLSAMPFYRSKLYIPGGPGNNVWTYDNTTLAAIGGTNPQTPYMTVYKDRMVGAGKSGSESSLYFSNAGDGGTWDLTNSFINADYPVVGLASLSSAIMIFTTQGIDLLRGNTPPPGSDMIRDHKWDIGCLDARSIAYYEDKVIWADDTGLYMTDGATNPENLCTSAGIRAYWATKMSTYDPSTWSIGGGVYGDYYMLSVQNSTTIVFQILYHVPTRSAYRTDSAVATMFVRAQGSVEELYFASRGSPRLGKISSFFSPTASTKNEASGQPVQPLLDTPYYYYKRGTKQWVRGYLTHDTRDAASDNPVQQLSYAKSPELTSYTNAGTAMPESTQMKRDHRSLGFASEGVSFRIQQTNASSDTRIYAIEADVVPREGNV